MGKIQSGKLLYHLTALQNIPGIIARGLLPRSSVVGFEDVGDPEILRKRAALRLETYVPFHWFCNNPFDGAALLGNPKTDFALITVRRAVAREESWRVIPRHPLANGDIELLDFDEGVAKIDWPEMERRDYGDANCKSICMAECLSPGAVQVEKFFKIYAPNENVASQIAASASEELVAVNPWMFGARSR